MNLNKLIICFFTSTKGHWGRKDIFKTTLQGLKSHLSGVKIIAHIKYSNEELNVLNDMMQYFKDEGVECISSSGNWSHGEESHQKEYCKDIAKVGHTLLANKTTSSYILFMEDDWLFHCYNKYLFHYVSLATRILDEDQELTAFRFIRHMDEMQRINALPEKHGLMDKKCIIYQTCVDYQNVSLLRHNDWSNNPFIMRTRDFIGISKILDRAIRGGQSVHSEVTISSIVSFFSFSSLPFVSFPPSDVRVLHIGTKHGEEDVP